MLLLTWAPVSATMRAMTIRTRFAPSPTGPLHLGNLRTALFSALFARRHGGRFLLRIEDTDLERSRDEFLSKMLDDLRWTGLDWDEGPEADGDHGPYLQSQRAAVYAHHFEGLLTRGLAYHCFCSDERLKLERKAQLAAGRPPRYSGICARLSADEAEARLARGERATLRFRIPAGREVAFDDIARGPQRFASDEIGDFVIRRSDGTPAFFFSNALDDALMGITHVLRGEDHLANTPRQLLLLEALDLPAPAYGHLPLLVGDDGAPLSKRHRTGSLEDLRAAGFLPLALLNHLARLGHHYEDDVLLDLDGLAAGFGLERVGRAAARHDEAQLRHWQRLAVNALDDDAMWDWISGDSHMHGAALRAAIPPGRESAFVQAMRDNLLLPHDARVWAERLFADMPVLDEAAATALRDAGRKFFDAALDALEAQPQDYRAFVASLSAASGCRGKALYAPLRAALTGTLDGPELVRVWALLGPAAVRERLEAALDRGQT